MSISIKFSGVNSAVTGNLLMHEPSCQTASLLQRLVQLVPLQLR